MLIRNAILIGATVGLVATTVFAQSTPPLQGEIDCTNPINAENEVCLGLAESAAAAGAGAGAGAAAGGATAFAPLVGPVAGALGLGVLAAAGGGGSTFSTSTTGTN